MLNYFMILRTVCTYVLVYTANTINILILPTCYHLYVGVVESFVNQMIY